MPILVAGATGNVGRPTVSALLAKGHSVRALSRSEDKLSSLPQGAGGAVADLDTGSGLDAALAGVERMFLITANGETESARGLGAVAAATAAGVRRIVYLSVQDPDEEPPIPHSRSKLPIEDAIRQSGCQYTILRPGYFFQTDFSVGQVIRDYGVYAMPIGSIGQNRVDTRDIADCAVRALTEDGHSGAEYELYGPDTISGPGAAEVYARHFGRRGGGLSPGYFFQTDFSVGQVIRDYGVYAMPIGSIGQNRVDTRDIADCAVRALTEDGHSGAEYELYGPDTISGPGAAEVYARHFGREVHYGGDDVEKWAEPIKAFIAPWLLESLKKMFLSMQRNGPAASEAAVAASREAVGHPLRTFDAFAAELAASMKQA